MRDLSSDRLTSDFITIPSTPSIRLPTPRAPLRGTPAFLTRMSDPAGAFLCARLHTHVPTHAQTRDECDYERIALLQLRERPMLAAVVRQLIVGKGCTGNDVGSHRQSLSFSQCVSTLSLCTCACQQTVARCVSADSCVREGAGHTHAPLRTSTTVTQNACSLHRCSRGVCLALDLLGRTSGECAICPLS